MFRSQEASTRRGKKKAAAAAAPVPAAAAGKWSQARVSTTRRKSCGAATLRVAINTGVAGRGVYRTGGEGEPRRRPRTNPWQGVSGSSLCQFWRFRLLLEVVLAARGLGEDEEATDPAQKEASSSTGRAGSRLDEVLAVTVAEDVFACIP